MDYREALRQALIGLMSLVLLVPATCLLIPNIYALPSIYDTAAVVSHISNNFDSWSIIYSVVSPLFDGSNNAKEKLDMNQRSSAEVTAVSQGSANPTKKVFTNFRHEYGFKFKNDYQSIAKVLSDKYIPDFIKKGDLTFTIQGRCGGMAYAALDYWYAHKMIPGYTGQTPSNDAPLSQYIFHRFYDSLDFPYSGVNKNALDTIFKTFGGLALSVLPGIGIDDMEEVPKFIFYTWTNDHKWACKCVLGVCTPCIPGVRDSTNKEIPKVTSSLDKGKPVVLGLIGARALSDLGRNHQVVAYGYEYFKDDRTYIFYIYDPNHATTETYKFKKTDSTVHPIQPVLVWHQDYGFLSERLYRYSPTFDNPPTIQTWRGFFVMDYTPKVPPEMFIDSDKDEVDDSKDNCIGKTNPDQKDENNNGIGDACELTDNDNDGIIDSLDNCKYVANPDQKDEDNNGVGDACKDVIL